MEVAEALRNPDLYNQRATQLKGLAEILVERYGGKVPEDWDKLTSLPGIGLWTVSSGIQRR
jgi:endonuclease III